ncbi:hypothetical protein HMPREF1870_02419 [Bacteroidales bacterium KA00344]|nr:hypothetical protein HMPREF1870_02419 [Bacteroidales bacterium KA00344]
MNGELVGTFHFSLRRQMPPFNLMIADMRFLSRKCNGNPECFFR